MHRTNVIGPILAAAFVIAMTISGCAAQSPKSDDSPDDHFDVRRSVGDLHQGKDADAQKAGLPLYPGARPKPE